jgi:hypothetical protein
MEANKMSYVDATVDFYDEYVDDLSESETENLLERDLFMLLVNEGVDQDSHEYANEGYL